MTLQNLNVKKEAAVHAFKSRYRYVKFPVSSSTMLSEVFFETQEGDCLNLKSILSQYILCSPCQRTGNARQWDHTVIQTFGYGISD